MVQEDWTDQEEQGRVLQKPLLSFQVITDTHIRADASHIYNLNLVRALEDIAANGRGSAGIMHIGDITDHGLPEEYAEWKRIWNSASGTLPPLYLTMGNHDVGFGEWEANLGRYFEETGTASSYHDHWIDGYHFIFMGTEEGMEIFCSLSDEQLNWLDGKLGEDASPDRPVFLFLHQPLKDTVAGSLEEQKWYGVVQDTELKAILARHPQAVLFTGHTHWEMEAPRNYFDGEKRLPAMFNAASIAYLWTDEDEAKAGSQGYYVEVYPDYVQVRGRDFTSGKWIDAARYKVSYSKESQV